MDIEKDIFIARKIIQGNYNFKEGHYNTIYNMTNEKLALYFKYFPIKGGTVLTVLGSGDNVLQAACCGANRIYAFDYNPLALYMAKLKIKSFSILERNEFLNYLYNIDYRRYFDASYYKKVRDYLDSNTMKFWDSLYREFNNHEITDSLINNGDSYINRSIDGFLNRDKYYQTKNNLENIDIQYLCSDVFDIFDKIPSDIKFNAVLLSNIFDWMNLEDAVKYPLFIKRDLDKYLYKDALIAVHSSVNRATSNALSIIFEDKIEYDNHNKVIVYKKEK